MPVVEIHVHVCTHKHSTKIQKKRSYCKLYFYLYSKQYVHVYATIIQASDGVSETGSMW